jgi:TolB-like protein/AraC-like DNA-binding protein/Tfp pilus assembly protein PilF
MADFLHPTNEFLQKVIAIIEENLADEHFEVPDLAEQLNMSRSNLLRKVKSLSGLSVSVFIRQVRLHHAKEMLKDDSLTISEISFKVGFSSTSYFTKCFRESFGYPPGEERSKQATNVDYEEETKKETRSRAKILVVIGTLIAIVSITLFSREASSEITLDKSIAVLPFKNDSDDSSNVYIINGLMETILDNLQKIEDLDVTSRTTVEKYRGLSKTIPELSRELGVSYFVEGSGQKLGNQILLTIQLIDAKNDRHVWSQQYARKTDDIFQLQMEVAKDIANKIEAIITPEEQRRIEKIPTENLVAYDLFLKGSDLVNDAESNEELQEAINYFKQAIEEDSRFAHPYAYIAICYYYLDIFQADKQFGQEINTYADKALLYDDELPESLLSKALFYMQDQQYELAEDYFEKTLEYSPGSARVHNYLSDIYTNYIPNTELYLLHAVQGIRTAISGQDSSTASFTYLHLSNALAQTGFIKEAEKYALKSIEYNPQNLFAEYLYTYIRLAQNFDLNRAKNELIATYKKDTMRLDVIQEIAKVCYTMEDYEEAWIYYEKFIEIKEMFNLDIYPNVDVNIAFVLEQLGRDEEAAKYYESFLAYAESDESVYGDLNRCAYYAANGETEKAIKYFKAFTDERDYFYWLILFLDKDPVILKMSDHSDFKKTLKEIEENFWEQHRETRQMLEEKGVI